MSTQEFKNFNEEILTPFLQKHPKIHRSITSLATTFALFLGLFNFKWKSIIRGSRISFDDVVKFCTVMEKSDVYCELSKGQQDEHGFIHPGGDSLLFTSLYGCFCNVNNIYAARHNGQWYRNPLGPKWKGSESTISRDMLLGLMWYAWENKDLNIANHLWSYGKQNAWIMGSGDVTRTYFTPGLQATLAEIIFRLGGKNHRLYRRMNQNWPSWLMINGFLSTGRGVRVIDFRLKGYECHLAALHLALRANLMDGTTKDMRDCIEALYSRNPDNALFSYLHGRYILNGNVSEAINLLNDQKLFPEDRLPNNTDRASPWLFERDYGDDWLPDGEKVEHHHTGGELSFVFGLIYEDYYQ